MDEEELVAGNKGQFVEGEKFGSRDFGRWFKKASIKASFIADFQSGSLAVGTGLENLIDFHRKP